MKNNGTGKMFAGFDQGHFTLPQGVLDRRRRLAAFTAASDWPVDPWPAAHAALVDQVRAVADGGPPPDVTAVVAAKAAYEVITGTLGMVRRQVADELARDVELAVTDHADEILVGHLRPALEEVLATVTTAAKAAPVEVLTATDSMLLSAKDSVRKAALAIDGAALRYQAIRLAHWCVRQTGAGVQQDQSHWFGELKRMEVAWPTHNVHFPPQRAPWENMTPRARLLYVVTSGGEPWLPTAGEQDARFLEVHGAAVAAHADAQRQGRAIAGVFG